ncbi:MAG: hypothetical protein D8M59_14370 [Planctomycetes bacterium]|nr:hypothetical protein [Planctomycetota bacterium]
MVATEYGNPAAGAAGRRSMRGKCGILVGWVGVSWFQVDDTGSSQAVCRIWSFGMSGNRYDVAR